MALALAACGDDEEPVAPIPSDEEPADDVDDPTDENEPDGDDGDGAGDDDDDGLDDEAEVEAYAISGAEDIDEDYLLAVLDRMHEGLVPAIASSAADGEVNDELAEANAQVYVDHEHYLEGWEYRITGEFDGEEVAQVVDDPEPRTYRNADPLVVDDDCVVLLVEWDESGWYDSDDEQWRQQAVKLSEAEPAPPVNPTPWRIDGKADVPDTEWCL